MNRGTAVRGRADLYRLTAPGLGHEPVPMRFDPDGVRLTPERPVRKRKKKVAEDGVTGTTVPVSGAVTGTGDAVDDPAYGNPGSGKSGVEPPVDKPTYRNDGSAEPNWSADAYRNPGTDLPEPLSTVTGTGVPPTNQTNHDHPSKPPGSPLTGTSPTADQANKIDHDVVSAEAINDAEIDAARDLLATLPDFGIDFEIRALEELAAEGHPGPNTAQIMIRAVEIATRPTSNGGS